MAAVRMLAPKRRHGRATREREAVAIPDLQLIGLAPNQLLTPEMGKTSLVAGEAIPLELSQWSIPCSLFTIVIEDI